jgi:hypothetical protein
MGAVHLVFAGSGGNARWPSIPVVPPRTAPTPVLPTGLSTAPRGFGASRVLPRRYPGGSRRCTPGVHAGSSRPLRSMPIPVSSSRPVGVHVRVRTVLPAVRHPRVADGQCAHARRSVHPISVWPPLPRVVRRRPRPHCGPTDPWSDPDRSDSAKSSGPAGCSPAGPELLAWAVLTCAPNPPPPERQGHATSLGRSASRSRPP